MEGIYICPNCKTSNDESHLYCKKCGQKNKNLKMKIFEFINEFFDSVFNIDNKFFKTTLHLFVPAKLTKAFFSGIRQKYHHPLRIYFLSVILLFFVLSALQIEDYILKDLTKLGSDVISLEGQKKNIRETLNDQKEIYRESPGVELMDTLYNNLFFVLNKDTLYVRDTLKVLSRTIGLFRTNIELNNEEMFTMDPDSVIVNHNITAWHEKFIVRQILRITRNADSVGKYFFANLTWLFLALIPIFAFILKLFYIGKNHFFVEHYVFLLHLFATLFLATSLLLVTIYFTGWHISILPLLGLFVFIFPLIAFIRYYQQSWIKTFIKYLFIGGFFFTALAVCVFIFGIVAAMFF